MSLNLVYGQSVVMAALKETLRALTQDNFITRSIAEKIFMLGCQTMRLYLKKIHTSIKLTGSRISLYRFRRNVWTIFIEGGQVNFVESAAALPIADDGKNARVPPMGPTPLIITGQLPPGGCLRLHRPIKIIAADETLYKRQKG